MGRGKDKTINASDLGSMSPRELAALGNAARLGLIKIKGTALVRGADGNARYDPGATPGQYNEDKVS